MLLSGTLDCWLMPTQLSTLLHLRLSLPNSMLHAMH